MRIGRIDVVDDAKVAGRCPLEPLVGHAFGDPAGGIWAQSVFRAIRRDYGIPTPPLPLDSRWPPDSVQPANGTLSFSGARARSPARAGMLRLNAQWGSSSYRGGEPNPCQPPDRARLHGVSSLPREARRRRHAHPLRQRPQTVRLGDLPWLGRQILELPRIRSEVVQFLLAGRACRIGATRWWLRSSAKSQPIWAGSSIA